MRTLLVLAVPVLMASGCLIEDGEPTSQRPASTYEFLVEGTYDFEETFDTPSCVYSRQEPNLGQYSIDARMVDQPDAENKAVIQLRFPGSIDEPPAAGTYNLPDGASVVMTFDAPLGSMTGTEGVVTVTDLADFRKVEVEGTVEGATETGDLIATLYCPL